MQENIPVDEVFKSLECTREGLTGDEVKKRLELFGYNKLEEKKVQDQLAGPLCPCSSVFKYLFSFISACSFFLLFCWFLQESKILKFLGFMWNPLSWVMEAAALMAIGLAHGGVIN